MASTAYCRWELFDKIISEDNDNRTLLNTIHEFYHLCMEISDEELIGLVENHPILKILQKREFASVYTKSVAFQKIDEGAYECFLNDFLILDNEEDADKAINEYGILAATLKGELFNRNSTHFGYSFNRNATCKFKCWYDVLGANPLMPSNSAIIIDNFLWRRLDDFHEQNSENLYPILDCIIPKSLRVSYHIIFVLQNNDGRFNINNTQEKLKKIVKKVSQSSGVPVKAAIITQTDTKIFHERVIITNHQYIYSDKGFTIFSKGKVIEPTKGDRNFVLKDIDNYKGEIRKHQQLDVIRNVEEAIKKNQTTKEGAVTFNVGNLNNPLFN